MIKKIYISAGETSGDIHGGGLARELYRLNPKIEIYGMGGERMKNAGVNLIADCRNYAVMGFFGIIKNIFRFKKLLSTVSDFIIDNKINLVVLIDYSGFNLRLAKAVKLFGVKVVYFVSPQVWAWRTRRVKSIKRYVDRMITIFPFEKDFYEHYGIDADFVGHPLLDSIPAPTIERKKWKSIRFKAKYKIPDEAPLLSLFPGSRKQELDRMFITMLRTGAILQRDIPNLQILVALAPGMDITKFKNTPELLSINPLILFNDAYDILEVADAVLVSSGTTTIEAGLFGVPQVVMYKTNTLTYHIARMLVKVKHIAMVNLILGERIIPEFIQNNAQPENLGKELLCLLTDDKSKTKAMEIAVKLRQVMGNKGAYGRAAEIVLRQGSPN